MRRKIALCFSLGFIAVASLHSCKIVQPEKSYSRTDSTIIRETPVSVDLPGAKVGASLDYPQLLAKYQKKREQYLIDSTYAAEHGKTLPKPPETEKQSFSDPDTKALLTYWIDAAGKLQLGCESKDQVVTLLQREVTRLTNVVKNQKEVVKEVPGWIHIVLGVVGTLLVISVLLNFIIIKFK